MKVLKYFGLPVLSVVLFFVGFIIYSQFTWYDPPQKLVLSDNLSPDTIHCDSTISVLSWNIGYAGLGDNMDFFYDGGKKVRDTHERTSVNIDSISHFLKRQSNKSFVLIQEVDIRAKRSYHINEKDIITSHTNYLSAFALNYSVGFVPIPPTSPMGTVRSGIMTLGNFLPDKSIRYAYPGMFGWPNRLFNLRRCMLVNRYPTNNGKEFILINTHQSAFDDGSLKKQEMNFLRDFISAEYSNGNYVVVGGDWNQSPPEFKLTTFGSNFQSEDFILSNIPEDFLPAEWKWSYNSDVPTNRYLNTSYISGETFRCLIDFFLVSPNVQALRNNTFDLNFRNSDHNPIEMEFKLIK